ncbi:hypothetical protein XELAEV_18028267mg [Xenopus laevis]|uniref:Uncharacterized protein n=1 Tax=Xenopus laevis TaxID=8355 RepID=A0A974CZD7_XENLA|nr:hypothetical protein XELAEV_18028267mg [Xenopus laevis]
MDTVLDRGVQGFHFRGPPHLHLPCPLSILLHFSATIGGGRGSLKVLGGGSYGASGKTRPGPPSKKMWRGPVHVGCAGGGDNTIEEADPMVRAPQQPRRLSPLYLHHWVEPTRADKMQLNKKPTLM